MVQNRTVQGKQKVKNVSGSVIDTDSEREENTTDLVASSLPDAAQSPVPTKKAARYHRKWGGKTFHFRFTSFHFGRDLATRRFSLAEAAFLLMLAYITSKGLGVVRQSLFNAIFGAGPTATAYYAAFNLPDTLFNLIAGGALSSAFLPVFLSYEKEHGEREVWRLTSLVFNVLLVSFTIVLSVAEWCAPTLVNTILVPGLPPAERALTVTLTRIMLLHSLILGLGTIATAVLNGKRQFLLPALAIAIYDVGLIGGLLVTLVFPRVGIYGPTYGLLVSAVCQVAVLLPGLLKQGGRYSWLWDLRYPGLREVLRLLGPNVLAVSIASTSIILDSYFASYLPDGASIPALRNAALLFTLPVTLIAQAVGQALLPQLAAQATYGRYVRMRQTTLNIVGGAVLIGILAATGICVLGKPMIALFFQHGAFDAHAASLTLLALFGYAVGIPGLIASGLLVLAFYALKDARTPLLITIVIVFVRLGLIFVLLKVIAGPSVLLALPLAASLASTMEAILLGLLLFRQLRSKVATDRGMQRLQKRRIYLAMRQTEERKATPS